MDALKAGVTALEFWEMTPRETFMTIDAALWREEQRERRDTSMAWHTAALMRSKRMPALRQLLNAKPAKPLKGRELEERRQQHREMVSGLDLSRLGRKRNE